MTIGRSAVVVLFCVGFAIRCAGQGTGSLKITVTDETGAIIGHAQVQVTSGKTINAVADENGNAFVEGLPPETYSVTAKFRGFADGRASGIVVSVGMKREVVLKLELTPPILYDIQSYATLDLYSYDKLLGVFKEASLCHEQVKGKLQSYRFLWLPTFDHPVLMRVDFGEDGHGILRTKILSGKGGYGLGKVATDTTRRLSHDQEYELVTTLADIGFWTLPARVEIPNHLLVDGTLWFVEGVRNGECHIVERVSSPLTDVFRDHFLGKVGEVRPYYQSGNSDSEQGTGSSVTTPK
jgi:hypothetical protein